jgi:riboflavin kinase/FMN adenylyltransferase
MLRQLTEGARTESSRAAVLTFEPHPAVVLGGQADFRWLSPPEERTAILESLGVDLVINQHFDLEFAAIDAGNFMQTLVRQLDLRHLLVGYDFALGRDRLGNASLLSDLGVKLGYRLHLVAPLSNDLGIISSTRIRRQIQAGEVEQAAGGLGHPYPVSGKVVHGDGRGRTINIPTANLEIPSGKLIPARGVYACWAWLAGNRLPAATNIGMRPTFMHGGQELHVETHILDFHADLYGQEIRLDFIRRLRDEQRFPSRESLVTQIHRDIDQARLLLV